jgi:hypothetical protein
MLYIIMRGEVKPCPCPKFVLQSIHVNNTTQNLKKTKQKNKKQNQLKLENIGLHKSCLHFTLRMVTAVIFYFQKVQTYKTPV